jgi:hypothetical protein
MELQTAIEILEYHQEWRLGKREDMIHEPKKLTEALDIVLSEVKKFRLGSVSHSMTGDGMNSLEFFDMIKREWCISEEQYRPFWNDLLTFARKYHKERKEYCG